MHLTRFAPNERVRIKQPPHPTIVKSCAVAEWDLTATCVVTAVDATTHRVSIITEHDAKRLNLMFIDAQDIPDDYPEMEVPEECLEHDPGLRPTLN